MSRVSIAMIFEVSDGTFLNFKGPWSYGVVAPGVYCSPSCGRGQFKKCDSNLHCTHVGHHLACCYFILFF